MTGAAAPSGRTTLVYLARGADDGCREKFDRFVRAYMAHPAGMAHDLVIIIKGFASDETLAAGRQAFASLSHREIRTDDLRFDIGAYIEAVPQIDADRICFLNTDSEPAASDWLLKLAVNLERPGIGLVGATGSFEHHLTSYPGFPPFPNIHIRTNAFMLRSVHARRILPRFEIRDKWDAYLAESGPDSLTRQIMALGLGVLIVGRNGRGYLPQWWSSCEAFRQGDQANLLVHDNQTRAFANATWPQKKILHDWAWGTGETPGELLGPATP